MHMEELFEKSDMIRCMCALGFPNATCVHSVARVARLVGTSDLVLSRLYGHDRRTERYMNLAGYVRVRNPDEKFGRWNMKGKRVTLYAREELSEQERLAAADLYHRGGKPRKPRRNAPLERVEHWAAKLRPHEREALARRWLQEG